MKAEECAKPCWGKTKSFPSVAPLPQPLSLTNKFTGRQHTLQHQKVKKLGTRTHGDKCVQRHTDTYTNTNWGGRLPYISLSVSMVARLCCALFRMGGVYEGGLRDYQRGNVSFWACPPLSQSALRAGAVVQWHNTTMPSAQFTQWNLMICFKDKAKQTQMKNFRQLSTKQHSEARI